jgi:N-acyl amino acid synthase of PEP-CTERM/exosortase system
MAPQETANLGSAFKQYFEIVPAYTDALKDEVYRIRHQVYCEDLNFESSRPDRREIDEHDDHSLHLLMRSVKTMEFIGCARIVRPPADDPRYQLPFEKKCLSLLDRTIVDPAKLPRHTIGEVSRLAVVSAYRRRKGEASKPVGITKDDFGPLDLPRFPYISVGLYLGTTEMARLHGIETLFVLTEERLASHFRKLGVRVEAIGQPIEHRGTRTPSMMSVRGIINDIRSIIRPLYHNIAADIEKYLPKQRVETSRIPECQE